MTTNITAAVAPETCVTCGDPIDNNGGLGHCLKCLVEQIEAERRPKPESAFIEITYATPSRRS